MSTQPPANATQLHDGRTTLVTLSTTLTGTTNVANSDEASVDDGGPALARTKSEAGEARNNVWKKYSSMKFAKRDEWRGKLNESGEKKIGSEEKRIKKIKEMLERDAKKRHYHTNMKKSYVAWRLDVQKRPFTFLSDQDKVVPADIKEWYDDMINLEKEEEEKKNGKGNGAAKVEDKKGEEAKSQQTESFLYLRASERLERQRARRMEADEKQQELDKEVLEKEKEILESLKAGVMHFAKSGHVWGGTRIQTADGQEKYISDKFPDGKISMHEVLYGDHNPFTREEKKLKYFHFPANNMDWIQIAIERFYQATEKPNSKVMAERLLSREHWHGQIHGSGLGKGPIHARHMRSKCSSIPLDTVSAMLTSTGNEPATNLKCSGLGERDKSTKSTNFAIFMPYLHWETNGRRMRMANIVKEMTKPASPQPEPKGEAPRKPTIPRKVLTRSKTSDWHGKSLVDAAQQVMSKKFKKKKALGQYLFDLAQLSDAMEYDEDERIMRTGLHVRKDETGPPLHIRRTLDQSYFLTLDDTTNRDRDQVVYRETRQSRKNPSQLTRVVMVDQLWMWILDDHTIITSFPRRWGRNKPDSSGIHKSLRERLKQPENSEIQSVYHLALLIIDQCSRVFFDRTQPTDRRPEVMDLFAAAIGKLTDHTTLAFEVFWNNVELRALFPDPSEMFNEKRQFLNINPEGTLLRESQDISEELRIMARIFNQQLNVVKDFRKYLIKCCDPTRRPRSSEAETVMHMLASHLKCIADNPKLKEQNDAKENGEATGQDAPKKNLDSETEKRNDLEKQEELGLAGPTTATLLPTKKDLPTASAQSRTKAIEDTSSWNNELETTEGKQEMEVTKGKGQNDNSENAAAKENRTLEDTVGIADDFLEAIVNRISEISELEDAAARTSQQLQDLLSLKQQEASIVEAKAALTRADESVRQGRAIMAFTIVTIFFLPLGFFAGFFGMNNSESTDNGWMTLNEQITYMFSLSAAVIVLSLSIAFIPWIRLVATAVVQLPSIFLWEYMYLRRGWEWAGIDYATLKKKKRGKLDYYSRHEARAKNKLHDDTSNQGQTSEPETGICKAAVHDMRRAGNATVLGTADPLVRNTGIGGINGGSVSLRGGGLDTDGGYLRRFRNRYQEVGDYV